MKSLFMTVINSRQRTVSEMERTNGMFVLLYCKTELPVHTPCETVDSGSSLEWAYEYNQTPGIRLHYYLKTDKG